MAKELRPIHIEFELQRQRKQFTKANTEIRHVEDTLEYFKKLALKADFQSALSIFPYEGFEYSNWSQKSKASGIPVIQLTSFKGEVLIDIFDTGGQLHQYRVKLDNDRIKNLKNDFLSAVEPPDKLIALACETFKPINKIVKQHLDNSAIIIPSVNLVPIPSTIVLGSYCDSSPLSLIQASDVTGALSFAQNSGSRERPDSFIGIGNPSTKPIFDQAATAKFVKNTFPIRGLQIKPTEFPRFQMRLKKKSCKDNLKTLRFFLEEQASLVRGLQAASNMSMKNSVALVLATHGFVPNASEDCFSQDYYL